MTIKKNTQKHVLHQQLTGRFFGTTSYYEQQDSTSTVQTAAIFSPLMFPLGGFSLTVCSNESSAARAGETSARSPCRCHRRSGAKPRPHSSAEADQLTFPQTARITIRNVVFFLPNFHTLVRIQYFLSLGAAPQAANTTLTYLQI